MSIHASAPNLSDRAGPSSRPYPTMPAQIYDYTSVPVTFDPSSSSGAGSHPLINANQRPNTKLDPELPGQGPSIMSQTSSSSQQERPGDQSRRSTLPLPPSSSRTNSDPYPLMVIEHPTFLGLAQPAPKMKDQGVYHYVCEHRYSTHSDRMAR
ncbi:hypothetical protein IAU59_000048 [Kwoniella sp. CBS 9459]